MSLNLIDYNDYYTCNCNWIECRLKTEGCEFESHQVKCVSSFQTIYENARLIVI